MVAAARKSAFDSGSPVKVSLLDPSPMSPHYQRWLTHLQINGATAAEGSHAEAIDAQRHYILGRRGISAGEIIYTLPKSDR